LLLPLPENARFISLLKLPLCEAKLFPGDGAWNIAKRAHGLLHEAGAGLTVPKLWEHGSHQEASTKPREAPASKRVSVKFEGNT
jgi:hypothetical protein